MKHLSGKRKLWMARTQALRSANRLHHTYVRKAGGRGKRLTPANFYASEGNTERGWVSAPGMAAPSNFCLDENYDEMASFFDAVRLAMHGRFEDWLRKGKPSQRLTYISDWIDLSTIQRLTPSAALILAAEYDRIRRLSDRPILAINPEKWRPEVASVFRQLGLFEVLGIHTSANPANTPPTDGNLFILPMRSGNKVLGAEADELNHELAAVAMEAAQSSSSVTKSDLHGNLDELWLERALGIYSILIEAMDNVINHAYRDEMQSTFRVIQRWWMTAAIDRAESKLTVAIFDQGMSIPVSLPSWEHYSRVRRILRRLFRTEYNVSDTSQDGQVIRVATRVAVSATGLSHRGKGLPVMKAFIDGCRDGRLRIVSRCGEYRYVKGRGDTVESHPIGIGGTLIEWEIQL